MEYKTFQPHKDLDLFVDCYWTLQVPTSNNPTKQRIIPDGLIEMAFILGDDIKRFTSSNKYILQPRAMVLGQTIEPFFIEPTGYVDTFSIRFYPYGFAHLVKTQLKTLANKETPIDFLFPKDMANELEYSIINAKNTEQRIEIFENFLRSLITKPLEIDALVKSTLDTIIESIGSQSINGILDEKISLRRKLERKFTKYIGVSPKQLGRLIRFQAALKLLLSGESENLTDIAHQFEYYDQSHFIKDFKDFTGISPKNFLNNENLKLSSIFYK
ncbi:AraC family transcriptional regulator [Leptospira sp. GIMC2001]|uniref:AraC family transcriptional regulator n=1 Tax=Leptospira sp. GIMC2001 TaxID=1513297 RepID=UPI0023496139|nr:helix-turn-helix domain-containing protein [Leptospira sp. GIMC2001]WCL50624.1 helix-turn-helix domain-containing protein [Leptospira sp. GIMC2001]